MSKKIGIVLGLKFDDANIYSIYKSLDCENDKSRVNSDNFCCRKMNLIENPIIHTYPGIYRAEFYLRLHKFIAGKK